MAGLPHMLAYKVADDVSEMMMTHGGNSLEDWIPYLKTHGKRTDFAAEMLRQIIKMLKDLHSIGYSHGKLGLENICARIDIDGRLVFSLIDFGLCH
jgi:tRNA A-37 threonylcarbamoyl transferase component Bud32